MAIFDSRWKKLSIRYKVMTWIAMICAVTMVLLSFSSAVQNDVLDAYARLMDDNVVCYQLQEAIDTERSAFRTYILERSQENLERYRAACLDTRSALDALPFDYEQIGQERYARTWNMRNGYEGYTLYRDAVIAMDSDAQGYTEQLYQVMEMQQSLANYALRLVQLTLEDGNAVYVARARLFRILPMLHVLLAVCAAAAVLGVIRLLSRNVVRPMLRMASQTRQFEQGDFSGEDIEVPSGDEISQLVNAFNHMKYALESHIRTLEERNRMAQALHRQEMEQAELEQHLYRTRLEMLKSQVNPHFLFNTLNMISCMARLEDAHTTDRMILSLSNLFRYNLRTRDQEVFLEQELEALDDYIYIQQMRFDSRITYRRDVRVDASHVRIPSFMLQPVVENAFVHGLSAVESGGRIILRIWERGSGVVVSIADNGRGMTPQELEALRVKLRRSEQTSRGIGLGNICRRIEMMYPDGGYQIYSKPDRGTVIQFTIPQTHDTEER